MWKQLNRLFSKSVKIEKLLRAEKFGNINLYRQTVSLKKFATLGLTFLLWTNRNFRFRKNKKQQVDFPGGLIKNIVEFYGHDLEKVMWNFQES